MQLSLRQFRLIRIRLRNGSGICPGGGTCAQVELRRECPATRGVDERPSATGDGVSARGSEHTLVTSAIPIKGPTNGKEYGVLPVGSDDGCGAAKVPLIILEAR